MGLNKVTELDKNKRMDSKKLLEDLNVERAQVNLNLDKKLWKDFKEAIGKAPQNTIVERLIREFLRGLKEKK